MIPLIASAIASLAAGAYVGSKEQEQAQATKQKEAQMRVLGSILPKIIESGDADAINSLKDSVDKTYGSGTTEQLSNMTNIIGVHKKNAQAQGLQTAQALMNGGDLSSIVAAVTGNNPSLGKPSGTTPAGYPTPTQKYEQPSPSVVGQPQQPDNVPTVGQEADYAATDESGFLDPHIREQLEPDQTNATTQTQTQPQQVKRGIPNVNVSTSVDLETGKLKTEIKQLSPEDKQKYANNHFATQLATDHVSPIDAMKNTVRETGFAPDPDFYKKVEAQYYLQTFQTMRGSLDDPRAQKSLGLDVSKLNSKQRDALAMELTSTVVTGTTYTDPEHMKLIFGAEAPMNEIEMALRKRGYSSKDPNIPPDVIQKAQQEVETNKARVQGAGAYATEIARAQAKYAEPIAPKDRASYFDSYGQQMPASIQTAGKAQEAGFTMASPEQRKGIPAARAAYKAFEQISNDVDKMLTRNQSILAVQGNRANIAYLAAKGDPTARGFEGSVKNAMIASAQAEGLSAARLGFKSIGLEEDVVPNTKDSVQSASEKLIRASEIIHERSGIEMKPDLKLKLEMLAGTPGMYKGKPAIQYKQHIIDPATKKVIATLGQPNGGTAQ